MSWHLDNTNPAWQIAVGGMKLELVAFHIELCNLLLNFELGKKTFREQFEYETIDQ